MKSINKIDFVVTARPSWSRAKNLILEFLKLNGNFSARIILLGSALSSKYGDVRSQMPDNVEINIFETYSGNENLFSATKTSIDGAVSLSQNWNYSRPESVLVIADRTETLGVSLAASIMQIPLVHLQGGEISGSIDNKIRGANSKLADFHLTTNEFTAANLEKLGEKSENIKIIGCPSVDIVFERLRNKRELFPNALIYGGVGGDFSTDKPYGIIMFHPDTFNLSQNEEWVERLLIMVRKSKLNWFWFWPNVDFGGELIAKRIRITREKHILENVRFIKNLAPEIFIDLAIGAKVMVGNSSFGVREASVIGLPVLNLGFRQFGRQRADNVLDVSNPIDLNLCIKNFASQQFIGSKIYGDGNASRLGAVALTKWKPKIKDSTYNG